MRDKAKSLAIDAALFGRDLLYFSAEIGKVHLIGWKNWGERSARGYVCQWEPDEPEVLETTPLTLGEALRLIDQHYNDKGFFYLEGLELNMVPNP